VVVNHRLDGVFYFTDEEGVYSLQLFDRLLQIRCPFAQLLAFRFSAMRENWYTLKLPIDVLSWF
jgi:hypothetical protein